MAPSAPSSSSSSADEPVYPHAMAASLAGLPVRIKQEDNSNAVDSNANGGKAKSGELKDFLDLAVSFTSPSFSRTSQLFRTRAVKRTRADNPHVCTGSRLPKLDLLPLPISVRLVFSSHTREVA